MTFGPQFLKSRSDEVGVEIQEAFYVGNGHFFPGQGLVGGQSCIVLKCEPSLFEHSYWGDSEMVDSFLAIEDHSCPCEEILNFRGCFQDLFRPHQGVGVSGREFLQRLRIIFFRVEEFERAGKEMQGRLSG